MKRSKEKFSINKRGKSVKTALQCGPPAATGSVWTTRPWMNLNIILEGRHTPMQATTLSHLHLDWNTHAELVVLDLKMPRERVDMSEQQSFIPNIHTGTTASTSHDAPPPYGATSPSNTGQPPETNLVNAEMTEESQNESVAQIEDETESIDSEEVVAPGRHRASLSDLTRVEDIEALTVRQLKEILARNFVNYKGCCEKWELMERVTRLYNEQKDLQSQVAESRTQDGGTGSSGVDENLCKICMDSPIDCVLLECGHMVTCTKCGKRMSECPICRQFVIRAVHVFRS
ncbi:E3 ubiquitin-protein ligase rififylin-like isoform X3 [Heptranchias perlo]|uniref:E3 ubiquitin-protein ligase rififylin-like isoform X3 n=1 Tax=Heptranchias perlo TaxID=212740 RepID=UPI0035598FAB